MFLLSRSIGACLDPQVLLAAVCTQFIRVYDLSSDAAAPLHTFYLPATVEDASGDGVGSCIRDVVLVPAKSVPAPPSPQASALGNAPRDAAAIESSAGTSPAFLATAVVLTGAGRLYGKGIPAPEPRDSTDGGGAAVERAHDGEIRHRLVVPPLLEEEARSTGDRENGGSGPGRGGGGNGGGGGSGAARGGDGSNSSESGGRGGRSESVGGASADTGGGGSGQDDEDVESPVSGMDSPSSPSYLYLSAFAGCDFDDVVSDSPDESLIFAEPGLRRRGWAGSSAAAASSSSAAAAVSAADAVLAMSPVRLARASAEAQETAAASFGALHFSSPTGLLVVARGGKSTLALRLRGAGDATAVRGGFVLLPRLTSGVGGGGGGASGGGGEGGGATPVAQGTTAGSARSKGSSAAAVASAAAAATTLEANLCLPPYTRFLDYWDGAGELAGGDDGSGGGLGHSAAAAAAAASLVCVAMGGGRVKADRVLAMRAGGGGGEGHAVSSGCRVRACRGVGDALGGFGALARANSSCFSRAMGSIQICF